MTAFKRSNPSTTLQDDLSYHHLVPSQKLSCYDSHITIKRPQPSPISHLPSPSSSFPSSSSHTIPISGVGQIPYPYSRDAWRLKPDGVSHNSGAGSSIHRNNQFRLHHHLRIFLPLLLRASPSPVPILATLRYSPRTESAYHFPPCTLRHLERVLVRRRIRTYGINQ